MAEPAVSKRQAASEHALATGGVPLDPYPGYLTWFVRECVERGAESGLDWLCSARPERENEIIETWCRLASKGGHLWAWREARARLEGLVRRGAPVPAPLARFAIVPAPSATRGPDPEGSRAVMIEYMVRVMQREGLDRHEVNAQLGESFPSPGRRDPGSSFRKRRTRGRPFVDPAFECTSEGAPSLQEVSRPVVLDYDWSEPVDAARVCLTSGWPAFALVWEFWPSRRDAHLRLWSERAASDSWVWDELRALFDHAVYCGWSLPPPLRDVVAIARPPTPSGRPVLARALAFAAVEVKLAELERSERAARARVAEAYEKAREIHAGGQGTSFPADLGFDLDDSSIRRRFFSGRERLSGVLAFTKV